MKNEKKYPNYVGKKMKGFKFESTSVEWIPRMSEYVGKVGEIINQHTNDVRVEFEDACWWYPINMVEEHLVEEEKPKFPIYAKWKGGSLIVKFTSKKVGEVIVSDENYEEGHCSDNWISCFSDTWEILPDYVEQPTLPKRGDEILVWGNDESNAKKRIFVNYTEGALYPVQVVGIDDGQNFKNGKPFKTIVFKNWKPLPKIKEYTYEELKQIVGHDFKIKE